MRCLTTLLTALVLLAGTAGARADDVYQDPRAFLEEVFGGTVPAPQKLWVKRQLKDDIRTIMGHDLGALRIRYWARDGRTAWILDDIGKEQFITTGLVVENGELSSVRVLIYRESRGWEVRYPAFTDQFRGAHLEPDLALDRGIDGISGATLSVHALTRLARLALLLDRHVQS
ncbi:MAG: FMN-binding protein [Gammaproteobacteria bacterium]|nr:FMN-binding protein [Gammaproteobacteria bacterium]